MKSGGAPSCVCVAAWPRPATTWSWALIVAFAAGVLSPAAAAPQAQVRPKSPEASLRAMRPRADFTVELVAAEPMVMDPIAIDWGADGSLWVVEMGDYPLGADNRGKPGGRIRHLRDRDGDGRYDESRLFLDGLCYPTGVMPWRKGVLVTAAPDIFYAEDTDGDGRADKREVLFTGFGEVNPQHRVNGLRWGIDNWVYCANGDFAESRDRSIKITREQIGAPSPGAREDVFGLFLSGAGIKSLRSGAEVDIRGRDFRIRPDEGLIDPQVGQSQFGRCCDDWGNWFGCNNAKPMWHFVLADQYIRRNPHVAAPTPRVDVIPSSTPVFAASGPANFTAACSVAIYRDDLFGPEFEGSGFVCDPVRNVVHRQVVSSSGVTFTARRAADEQESEFLTSTDPWFKPTMARPGPDGALWVVDMYRDVLEHPHWLPEGWEKRIDPRAGHERGRIYRVYPADPRPRPMPRLEQLDMPALVAALDSPGGWQRDMVQQLLIQRRDRAAVPLLENLAATSQRATCRLQALCILDGLGALRPPVLQQALADSHPGVRRHALRLAEPFLPESPKLLAAVLKLAADPDPQVQLQLAYTLGVSDDPKAAEALGRLALKHRGDRYIVAAVFSSVSERNLAQVATTVLRGLPKDAPDAESAEADSAALPPILDALGRVAIGLKNNNALAQLFATLLEPRGKTYAPWQLSTLAGLLDAAERYELRLRWEEAVRHRKTALTVHGSAIGLDGLANVRSYALRVAADPNAKEVDRLLAVQILGRGRSPWDEDFDTLAALLTPQTSGAVQSAAAARLAAIDYDRVPQILLAGWKGYAPELRSQILDVLLSRERWIPSLLEHIESKDMLPSEIDAARRQRLLEHGDARIRARAARLLAASVDPDRQKAVERYEAALALKGDARRGAAVFEKRCASCHQFRGVGNAVGPDLAALSDKSPRALLIATLDPNRAVEAQYVSYVAVTKQGLTYTGMLAVGAGDTITLLTQESKQQSILRADLESLESSGKSLMPEGLENDLSPQDLADVIAHITAPRSDSPP